LHCIIICRTNLIF